MFNPICLKMKKLKRLSLNPGQVLSPSEMTNMCGGEFLVEECTYEGQKCYLPAIGGVNTGTCKKVNISPTAQVIKCILD